MNAAVRERIRSSLLNPWPIKPEDQHLGRFNHPKQNHQQTSTAMTNDDGQLVNKIQAYYGSNNSTNDNSHANRMLNTIELEYKQRCEEIQQRFQLEIQNKLLSWIDAREKLYDAEIKERIQKFRENELQIATTQAKAEYEQLLFSKRAALMEDHYDKLKSLHQEREELSKQRLDMVKSVEEAGASAVSGLLQTSDSVVSWQQQTEERLRTLQEGLEKAEKEFEIYKDESMKNVEEEKRALNQEKLLVEEQKQSLASVQSSFSMEKKQFCDDYASWQVEKQLLMEQIEQSPTRNASNNTMMADKYVRVLQHAEDVQLQLNAAIREIHAIYSAAKAVLFIPDDVCSNQLAVLPRACLQPLLDVIRDAAAKAHQWSMLD